MAWPRLLRGILDERVQDAVESTTRKAAAKVASIFSSTSLHPDIMPSTLPSLRSVAKVVFGSAQLALFPAYQAAEAGSPASCPNPQLSCHNTTAANTCCLNAPGGQLLQTQFWDTNPVTGPNDSWTIHGLWPDHCDGTYDSYCDTTREYTNITAILQSYGQQSLLDYMDTYWKDQGGDDETFWEHEWGKHATCISTLDPDCYTDYTPQEEVPDFFNKVVSLFKGLDTYQTLAAAGILPSTTQTYTSAQIQAAIYAVRGHDVTLGCSSGALDEVWYHYNVQGSVQTGTFIAADPDGTKSTCPDTGVMYLPKGSSSSPAPTSTSGTTSAPAPTSTGAVFSGKGYLDVTTGGSSAGCIISVGTWFMTGTCATFIAAASADGFTLTSSKGNCGIVGGTLVCGSSVSIPTVFSANGSNLSVGGNTDFYSDSVPAGTKQGNVYTASHATTLQIEWQGL